MFITTIIIILYLNNELYPTVVNKQYYIYNNNHVSAALYCKHSITVFLTSPCFVSQWRCEIRLEETHFQTCSLGVTPIRNFCSMFLKQLTGSPLIQRHLKLLWIHYKAIRSGQMKKRKKKKSIRSSGWEEENVLLFVCRLWRRTFCLSAITTSTSVSCCVSSSLTDGDSRSFLKARVDQNAGRCNG